MDQSQPRPDHESGSHPPEFFHRVHLLSCAHCGCFVSDRGMKAVLLLRPSITLFSTDGMPYNCGPVYQDGHEDNYGSSEPVERTCDCLTQSMGCYGCGNTIGYHIICPCSRCVDSVSKHRRAANGHRWVFHYGEVTYEERCYVDNEPGVYNAHSIVSSNYTGSSSQRNPPNGSSSSSPNSSASYSSSSSSSTHSSLSSFPSDYSSWEIRERDLTKPDQAPYDSDSPHISQALQDIQSNLANPNLLRLPLNRYQSNRPSPSFQIQRSLKPGDPVYWHHLISAGERPVPVSASPSFSSRPAR
ncbi:FAM72 protein-domain-containing protein [Phakopsora pachyrhizi]|uniref:FAM72 protein-domain-containing protein n=1 Tax=Phakopsora pachyrhizi TaxID=170000 RepID=A0AAV0BP53_PHAPC|nr:FAM72 protein-domain-containing protein [Phakopsora pachyrhizi]CAH7688280.1 FAM72 protein-domain-containing protein [Phakopsora pachyrhizi]